MAQFLRALFFFSFKNSTTCIVWGLHVVNVLRNYLNILSGQHFCLWYKEGWKVAKLLRTLLLRYFFKSLSPCRGELSGQGADLYSVTWCLPLPPSTVCESPLGIRNKIKIVFPNPTGQLGDGVLGTTLPFASCATSLFWEAVQSGFGEYGYLNCLWTSVKSLAGSKELECRGEADKGPGAPSGLILPGL